MEYPINSTFTYNMLKRNLNLGDILLSLVLVIWNTLMYLLCLAFYPLNGLWSIICKWPGICPRFLASLGYTTVSTLCSSLWASPLCVFFPTSNVERKFDLGASDDWYFRWLARHICHGNTNTMFSHVWSAFIGW